MCGFCGFIGPRDERLIRKMTKVVGHRGPDGEGFFTSDQASFGHCRLAIIDLSKKGRQPMFNEDRSVILVFNGEIFNFQDLREQLVQKRHRFKSQTDTETVIHAYEEWGLKAIEKFRGFFAFALWDKNKKTLYLVRDRIGVKPLYYCHQGDQLFFASEIKAILENRKITREVNERAYYQYLAFQASLGEETLFQGIKKVPPATTMTFKEGKISLKKYWQLEKTPPLRESPASRRATRRSGRHGRHLSQFGSQDQLISRGISELSRRFKKLLLESVKLRLIADVPLGVLLSGGLDSSSIVALMSQLVKQPIKTFSVGFGQPDDELNYARLVAERFKTDHQELIIAPKEIQKVLKKIVWHQDEPLADGGGVATYLAAQAVSQHVKVVLIGEGGDELFGGYSWYKLGVPPINFFPESIRQRIYFYLTTFYRKGNCQAVNQWPEFQEKLNAYSGDFLSKMIHFEVENILPNSLCMKVDKMTSAWGLEAREPFLDHQLAEFCFSLPVKYKVDWKQDKILFRRIMVDLLPEEIIKRKKHGFLLPTDKWLKGKLKNFTKEILLDKESHTRKFYSRKEIGNFFRPRRFLAEIERVNLLWRLLIFELWYKIYF